MPTHSLFHTPFPSILSLFYLHLLTFLLLFLLFTSLLSSTLLFLFTSYMPHRPPPRPTRKPQGLPPLIGSTCPLQLSHHYLQLLVIAQEGQPCQVLCTGLEVHPSTGPPGHMPQLFAPFFKAIAHQSPFPVFIPWKVRSRWHHMAQRRGG